MSRLLPILDGLQDDTDKPIQGGVVQGHIRANFIIIAGTVQGDVQALESLDLHASARVESQTIHYCTLEMETGAIISGQLRPQLIPPKEAA